MNELVISIVFDNKECFKTLDKQQTKMLLFICKEATKNENIEQMRVKYAATTLHETFEKCVTSLTFAINKNDLIKIEELQNKIDDILKEVHTRNNAISDAFKMLAIAEYKELVFNSIFDPTFERIESDILHNLHKIIDDNSELFNAYNHHHDPLHFIFDNKQCVYSFYELVEKHGQHSILDKWTMSDGDDSEEDYYTDEDF
jgi:hypothetical protein